MKGPPPLGEPGADPPRSLPIASLALEILETTDDAFCAVDAGGRIAYVNRAACEALDRSRDALVGEVLWERLPQLTGTSFERRLREAVATGAKVEYEIQSPVSQRWFRVRAYPIGADLFALYWRDITDRKATEEEIRRTNERFHLAMDSAGVGTWEVDILSGTRRWTEEAKRVMGVVPETEPSYEAFVNAAHPEDRERVDQAYRRAYDPASGGSYAVEYRVPEPDGRVRWVAARGRTLFDGTGRPVRMIGVTMDVSAQKEREQALLESQELFRTMLEALPQIAFVVNASGIAEYYNRRFIDYVGHPIGADLAARNALSPPEDQEKLIAAWSAAVRDNEEYSVEVRIRRHDGAERWHVLHNRPLKRDGRIISWLGTAVDIHDMREAQERLRRMNDELERRVIERTRDLAATNARLRHSEESYRTLFNKAPVPMHALDLQRRLIDVNEHWLDLFGYTREEVIGRPISDFYLAGLDALHDQRWHEMMREGALREAERTFIKKNGEHFIAVVSAHLEKDAAGNFQHTITAVVDITARKRAEEAVRREKQRSELLIESSTEGIIGLDPEWRYTAWNAAMEAISGIPRERILGRHLFDARPDLRGTPMEDAWRAAMEGRRTTLRDRPHSFAPPGRSGIFEIDYTPLYGPDRSILGALAFLRDITERRRIEDQLRQAQKMEAVGQLTGGVAHDFNNLLTVIIGNLDNMQRFVPADPDAQRMMAAVMRAANRAATLTHRLLAFARRQPLEPRPVDPNKLVTGMSELLRRSLDESITIETVLAGGLWRTLVDPNQLENALLNLAVNARDAMPSGGHLTIETANAHLDEAYAHVNGDVVPGQYVLIAVSDTGSGMSKEVAEKAFEPFFTTKQVGQGTGLGLPQVYGFVKQSGGHVKIYSEPGEGTTVKLYLPRLLASDVPREHPVEPRPIAVSATSETILVVEDDEDVRSYSAEILSTLGYRVLEASEGSEALRVLDSEPEVHLLFTDVGLPGGINGRQLADLARRSRPELRVLFTTGYARNAIVHQGRLDANVELIVKPFSASTLAVKIKQVLQGGEARP